MDKNNFTFIDLFSGVGGFRIALESLGGKCIGFSEIAPKAIELYKSNFKTSGEIEIGDITKVIDYAYADVLTGGVPCQSWSIAGKMRGFDDPRGKLWLDTINFTSKVMPKAFIYENVKGLADPRNKYNLDLIIDGFNEIGYSVYYKVLNAFDYGLPQSRERLFIVGIRKDIQKKAFDFPKSFESLPLLSNILDNATIINKVSEKKVGSKNSFHMASVSNKGNFYIFSDIRNGDNTIHSWDIIQTTKKEKMICLYMLKNRRKKIYGSKDGNPLSYNDIFNLLKGETSIKESDLSQLVSKGILKMVHNKYEFNNSKISAGINGVYRIFMPESHVFSTLTRTGNRDFIATESVPSDELSRKKYFIENVFKKKKFRQISIKEASRIQGFPDNFTFYPNYNVSMGLLGNAVAVDVVSNIMKQVLRSI